MLSEYEVGLALRARRGQLLDSLGDRRGTVFIYMVKEGQWIGTCVQYATLVSDEHAKCQFFSILEGVLRPRSVVGDEDPARRVMRG